ncbi:MAG: deoxyribonuclease IV [Thermodesulfobacteriota bacterium]
MRLGVHTSIAGGLSRAVDRAVELNCGAMQIFCRNPRSWAFIEPDPAEVELFREKRAGAGLSPVAVHASYLVNLSSPDDDLFARSLGLFKRELAVADSIGADFMVTHMGSSKGRGLDFALARLHEALGEVAASGLGEGAMILLENTAGGGDTVGSSLADIGGVIEDARPMGLTIGLCFDTCHGFAAGYPMGSAADAAPLAGTIEREAGPGSLRLIHLNDSKGGPSSGVDRHEHIGRGGIGPGFFRALVNLPAFRDMPLILETPKKAEEDDARNLAAVREFRRKR